MDSLKSISSIKDNSFHLLRHIWNDVHEDWPFYTQEECHTLKRRKPQNLTPESDTGSTSSGHSPCSTNPASPPQITMTSGSLKRHSYYDPGAEQPAPKKKRVSHFKRETPTARLSSGLGWGCHSPTGGTSPNSPRLAPHSPNLNLPASFADSVQQPEWGHGYQTGLRSPRRRSSPPPAPVSPKPPVPHTSSPRSPKADTAAVVKGEVESEGENNENSLAPQLQKLLQNKNKDFVTAYTTILSVEQRTRYKQDFNEHYANYRQLHSILDRVSKRFTDLENKLKEHSKDSPEFKV